MTTSIVVIATMQAKPGEEDTVEKALTGAAQAVHAEPGCLLYALHRAVSTPGEFVMIEKWSSQTSLTAHLRGAAMREVGAALRDALDGPPCLQLLEAVPIADAAAGVL